jgi:hypothetical protein
MSLKDWIDKKADEIDDFETFTNKRSENWPKLTIISTFDQSSKREVESMLTGMGVKYTTVWGAGNNDTSFYADEDLYYKLLDMFNDGQIPGNID